MPDITFRLIGENDPTRIRLKAFRHPRSKYLVTISPNGCFYLHRSAGLYDFLETDERGFLHIQNYPYESIGVDDVEAANIASSLKFYLNYNEMGYSQFINLWCKVGNNTPVSLISGRAGRDDDKIAFVVNPSLFHPYSELFETIRNGQMIYFRRY